MAELFEVVGVLCELMIHLIGIALEAGGTLLEIGLDLLSVWADRRSGKGPDPEL